MFQYVEEPNFPFSCLNAVPRLVSSHKPLYLFLNLREETILVTVGLAPIDYRTPVVFKSLGGVAYASKVEERGIYTTCIKHALSARGNENVSSPSPLSFLLHFLSNAISQQKRNVFRGSYQGMHHGG